MKETKENAFLAGIIKVEYALPETVEIRSYEKLAPGVPIRVTGEFEIICIEGLAGVEAKQQKQQGQDIYNTTLKFKADDNADIATTLTAVLSRGCAIYRLTTVTNEQYMLGACSKPFPLVKSTAVNPASPSGARITEYEVGYINTFALLPIVNSDDTVRGLSTNKMILE